MVRPEDFYSHTPPGRIMGAECEYDIQLARYPNDGDNSSFYSLLARSADQVIRQAIRNNRTFRSIVRDYPGTAFNAWLDNGGRLYQDCGLIEYSTPECLGPRAAAAADAAGILAVAELLEGVDMPHNGLYRRTGSVLPDDGKLGWTSQNGKTTGYHQNFIVPNSLFEKTDGLLDNALAADLVTRAWSWNGTPGPHGYEWSQKWRGIGTVSTRDLHLRTKEGYKPMAMYLDAANQDYDVNPDIAWSRIEIRFADAPLSRTAIFLGFAATSLTLRMAEHAGIVGKQLEALRLRHPLRSLAALATSPQLDAMLPMADGRRRMAADNIQEARADIAQTLSQEIELPADELAAIGLLRQAAQAQREFRTTGNTGPMALIAETVRKYAALQSRAGGALTNRNNRAVMQDFRYDRTDNFGPDNKSTGAGRTLEARHPAYAGISEQYVPLALAHGLWHGPPDDTRAIARVRQITALTDSSISNIGFIDWSGFNPADRRHPVAWDDPFSTYAA